MVEVRDFGMTEDGKKVSCYRITAGEGSLEVLDYGCTAHRMEVPDREGRLRDVCLGYDTVKEYEENDGYFGAVIGRYGNRIGKGRFVLNGQEYHLACNDGENHLHGGNRGFDKFVWQAEALEDGVRFFRSFPDGDEGYPGNLQVRVTYRFTSDGSWTLKYEAESDKDTIINMTNHCYFNMNGSGSGHIKGHLLKLNADFYTENGAGCLPNGKIISVKNSVFDFTGGKTLGCDMEADEEQLKASGGYDHNFVLRGGSEMKEAGELWSEESGISMKVCTTQPGIQIYTGNVLTARKGKGGVKYGLHDAVCMETQHFPNSMEFRDFPCVVLKKGERYEETTVYKFGMK